MAIGAATARLLAQEGAAVVIGDLLEAEGRDTEAVLQPKDRGRRQGPVSYHGRHQ